MSNLKATYSQLQDLLDFFVRGPLEPDCTFYTNLRCRAANASQIQLRRKDIFGEVSQVLWPQKRIRFSVFSDLVQFVPAVCVLIRRVAGSLSRTATGCQHCQRELYSTGKSSNQGQNPSNSRIATSSTEETNSASRIRKLELHR